MKTKNGFTLVELLVVIAIIGILIGMLLPAVQMVREAARRTSCSNNMRQIGLALMNYEGAHKRFPSGWEAQDITYSLSDPGWGWSATILPFLEGQNVHDQIDFDLSIDNPINEEIINNIPNKFKDRKICMDKQQKNATHSIPRAEKLKSNIY